MSDENFPYDAAYAVSNPMSAKEVLKYLRSIRSEGNRCPCCGYHFRAGDSRVEISTKFEHSVDVNAYICVDCASHLIAGVE